MSESLPTALSKMHFPRISPCLSVAFAKLITVEFKVASPIQPEKDLLVPIVPDLAR